MDQIQLLQIGASIIGGGAAGAIITGLVTSYKARILPIGKRIEVSPLFTSDFGGPNFTTCITVSDGTTDYNFPNLHVAEILLINRGNRDLSSFSFGITLSGKDKVVHVEPLSQDRHHVASLINTCTPMAPSSALDFKLCPLNRGDSYTLKLFIVAEADEPTALSISSPEPVRFTEIPSVAETLAAVASTMPINLGPLELRIIR